MCKDVKGSLGNDIYFKELQRLRRQRVKIATERSRKNVLMEDRKVDR